MGFNSFVRCLAVILLLGEVAVARSNRSDGISITVLVNNSAEVSASILGKSEAEAQRILQAAGIEVAWVHCQDRHQAQDICSRVPAANQFVIHLVPTGSSSNDSVFGAAFLGQNGTGKYCDVFVDRITQAEDNVVSLTELMGTVMAHELGHLLLGSSSHSRDGLMRPIWNHQCLKGIGMGKFLLTPQQSLLIRERYRKLAAELQRNQLDEGN